MEEKSGSAAAQANNGDLLTSSKQITEFSVWRCGRCALPLAPGRRLFVQTSVEAETELNRAVNTKSCSGPIMGHHGKLKLSNKEVEILKSTAKEAEEGERGALRLFIRHIRTHISLPISLTQLFIVSCLLSATCHDIKQHSTGYCIPSFLRNNKFIT